ncbi:Hsp20/alpha crystallin family protein [Klenkia terrae]|jgi:HSP20 family protein|uniref:Hsp20/alpha crystallin family protein n=1 Tax=Klenkia terrae TaxID=1052259 RepID=A0ABU8EB58_9ACTN|nr:Hsp20/alpha crystallin family protein [Klenkia terrae]SSC25745.1 Alpha crystallin/Hsp20 [Klenkia terrae]
MTSLQERRAAPALPPFTTLDRVLDDWLRALPLSREVLLRPLADRPAGQDLIRVDEHRDGSTLVVRAELPGIDPERDVDVVVAGGMLRIDARRESEEEHREDGCIRHELRRGHLTRTLPLPEGTTEGDVSASYRDGILEVRVPVAEQPTAPAETRVPVSRT